MKLEHIDTPALFIDIETVEHNLAEMQRRINQLGLTLRPHTKAHKIPQLAHKQIEHGAQGICTSKLGEAEVMLQGGITDVLITTPIAGQAKYQRLIDLHSQYPQATLYQVIDHPQHVESIAELAKQAGITVNLLIEVESGQQRCGVAVGQGLLEIIEKVVQTEGVHYAGIQAYSGHLQLIKGFEQRQQQARSAVTELFDFIDTQLKPRHLAPEIISGGGTGTYQAYQGLAYTEIQAGSYLFMDNSYCNIGDEQDANLNQQFNSALKVLSTVISNPTSQRAVIDAGMKSLSIDLGMPIVESRPDLTYQCGGDEHGILHLSEDNPPSIGETLVLTPSHCDTTLNNFDHLYVVRQGEVVDKWKIAGRGRSD
ncbi:DSD1 family PLP-dependent enzyme [Vibrio coralliilyticus]|uniref:DSD1 family PLP-dependent enzyme n=1 Tax=Vibrio coralliilyticus TaxID=190893 RepID=UPI0006CC3368|nr:DSD1 family PLP-dependent enzyme [Vibrio coralliilyticus]AXN34537.1 DSD1 family PLP-dependent enzyme [Vibrio coralliilyticus]KPH24880.1 threonine aldolase [Vibrio coralliilyticus]